MLIGHQVYLNAKARGENSMPEKVECLETVKGHVGQDLNGMVKPKLVEPQCPLRKGCRTGYDGRTPGVSQKAILPDPGSSSLTGHHSEGNRGAVKRPQGHGRGTCSRSIVPRVRNARSSTGREPYDDGDPIVVRAGESPVHGEGGQVRTIAHPRRVAQCKKSMM